MSTTERQAILQQFVGDAVYREYTKAANPIGSGTITKIPTARFSSELYEQGSTRIIPLDLSADLRCPSPATSPALCANFVRIVKDESIATTPNATSQLIYVIRGRGKTTFKGDAIPWKTGDFLALPGGAGATHEASETSIFYLIHDEPLLTYLGASATTPRFKPTLFVSEDSLAELAKIEKEAEALNRSRVSVLLGNKEFDQTLTVTHTLWAMLGVLPSGTVQLPHRHQSVALDLILDCKPGCYSLLGEKLTPDREILDPIRVDWQPYSAFVTPPGYWHAHYNESDSKAHLIPIQDAGLQTYLRALDIQFVCSKQLTAVRSANLAAGRT